MNKPPTMTRKELMAQCRYYKGEKECPYEKEPQHLNWCYEKNWVERTFKGDKFTDMLRTYKSVGLTSFSDSDGVPITLKALLFNRLCHWNTAAPYQLVEPFKKCYNRDYLNVDETPMI